MNIEVYQTIEEEDGTVTAYIKFIDEVSGKEIKRACVQGKTQEDFEAAIDEKKLKIEAEQTKKISEKSIVSAAIDKIKKVK